MNKQKREPLKRAIYFLFAKLITITRALTFSLGFPSVTSVLIYTSKIDSQKTPVQSACVNDSTLKAGFTSAIFLSHSVQAPHGLSGLASLATTRSVCAVMAGVTAMWPRGVPMVDAGAGPAGLLVRAEQPRTR